LESEKQELINKLSEVGSKSIEEKLSSQLEPLQEKMRVLEEKTDQLNNRSIINNKNRIE